MHGRAFFYYSFLVLSTGRDNNDIDVYFIDASMCNCQWLFLSQFISRTKQYLDILQPLLMRFPFIRLSQRKKKNGKRYIPHYIIYRETCDCLSVWLLRTRKDDDRNNTQKKRILVWLWLRWGLFLVIILLLVLVRLLIINGYTSIEWL